MELTAENIFKEITRYISEDVTYIEALVIFAEKHDIEVELIGEIVRRSQVLKSKVRDDAEKFNLMEKTSQLPV
jgi:hypothetical protein